MDVVTKYFKLFLRFSQHPYFFLNYFISKTFLFLSSSGADKKKELCFAELLSTVVLTKKTGARNKTKNNPSIRMLHIDVGH